MKLRRHLVIAAIAAVGALIATAAPASAATTNFTPTYTLGDGACAGTIDAYYNPDQDFEGIDPTIWIRPDFTFINPISGAYCGVNATLTFRNLDTGGTGTTISVPVGDNTPFGPNNGGLWVPLLPATGKGRIEATITTNLPNVPGKATFTAP
ncbi:hypothetical protein [Antrihabitans cavernicola]|uniref:Uncharacterized protein n=1 Tax=Antrihabitans cavernicola TaxID=2495913 RepID=A0A5A7S5U8_9NOCA|nr:hypothetical protein [Spelaeibacter cavernicola]KAA0018907.1 hypothetical protein FOY51_22975 [Spelaeibacter cavernicola]